MKKMKYLALLMAVLMCLSLLPMGALADEEPAEAPAEAEEAPILDGGADVPGGFVQDAGGWRFMFDDGTYAVSQVLRIDGMVVYFNDAGYVFTGSGWKLIDGNYYYFVSGVAYTGAKKISGSWYCFDEFGALYVGWVNKDTSNPVYYFDPATGRMVTGWKLIDGYYYYFGSDGKLVRGVVKQISGSWYQFEPDGRVYTGWIKSYGGKSSGDTFFYDTKTGKRAIGWKYIEAGEYNYFYNGDTLEVREYEGGYYYFSPAASYGGNVGTLMYGGAKKIDGSWYLFDENGKVYTGWLEYEGATYYYDTSNAKLTFGWKYIDGYWYYFRSNGWMATGWTWINSTWYEFGSDGRLILN